MKPILLLLACVLVLGTGCHTADPAPTPLPAMEPVDPSLIPMPPVRYSE